MNAQQLKEGLSAKVLAGLTAHQDERVTQNLSTFAMWVEDTEFCIYPITTECQHVLCMLAGNNTTILEIGTYWASAYADMQSEELKDQDTYLYIDDTDFMYAITSPNLVKEIVEVAARKIIESTEEESDDECPDCGMEYNYCQCDEYCSSCDEHKADCVCYLA